MAAVLEPPPREFTVGDARWYYRLGLELLYQTIKDAYAIGTKDVHHFYSRHQDKRRNTRVNVVSRLRLARSKLLRWIETDTFFLICRSLNIEDRAQEVIKETMDGVNLEMTGGLLDKLRSMKQGRAGICKQRRDHAGSEETDEEAESC